MAPPIPECAFHRVHALRPGASGQVVNEEQGYSGLASQNLSGSDTLPCIEVGMKSGGGRCCEVRSWSGMHLPWDVRTGSSRCSTRPMRITYRKLGAPPVEKMVHSPAVDAATRRV